MPMLGVLLSTASQDAVVFCAWPRARTSAFAAAELVAVHEKGRKRGREVENELPSMKTRDFMDDTAPAAACQLR